MKTKASPKRNLPQEADRFDRKGAKVKAVPHDKSAKRRLSIYDDFNDDDDDFNLYGYEKDE